jgi:peptide/nickel transport system permease protein
MTILSSLRILLSNRRFTVCGIMVVGFALVGIIGPFFTVNPFKFVGGMNKPPSWDHPLGTDLLGRDLFSQLLYGIRNSMLVGVIAGGISLLIAVALGGLSGYMRGLFGESINAFINIFLVIPTIPLLILLSAVIVQRSLLLVSLFIGFVTGWPGSARAIRAQVLDVRDKEYLNLAVITGKKSPSIIFGEVLPNMVAYIFLQFCGAFASAMLAEAGISLLGLGPADVSTLGMMLHWAIMNESMIMKIWWWFLPPGLVLIMISSCLYTMSSSVNVKR